MKEFKDIITQPTLSSELQAEAKEIGFDFKNPTHDMLKTWLRQYFNLHVEINWFDTLSNIYTYSLLHTGNGTNNLSDCKYYEGYYETFSIALSQGIKFIKNFD